MLRAHHNQTSFLLKNVVIWHPKRLNITLAVRTKNVASFESFAGLLIVAFCRFKRLNALRHDRSYRCLDEIAVF